MASSIFTWRGALKHLLNEDSFDDKKDWCSVFTYAKQFGLGKPVTFQKMEYTDDDLNTLRIVVRWWDFLNHFSNIEFRDKTVTKNLLKRVFRSVKKNEEIVLFGIFCPSYKKGIGEIGYTGRIGPYSSQIINSMISFIEKSNSIGLRMNGIAYFSDLLLENFESLKETEYKKDLNNNFIEFERVFGQSSLIKTCRLSEIERLRMIIGERGVGLFAHMKDDQLYGRVHARNAVFYEKGLGWTKDKIEKRTEILYASYAEMGVYFNERFPQGIMFWTESAYERGLMYNTLLPDGGIPIVYPTK